MESLLSPHSPLVLANYEPSSPRQPCHAGFEALTETERAARAEILHRAYSIWESKGRPENSQLADWAQAEAEVSTEC